MRKRGGPPHSLGEVLGDFLGRSGLNPRIQEQKILYSWDKAVGNAIAERTQPVSVRNRVLQVKVSNSVWMQELQFMKNLIIQRLQERTGEDLLKDLRFFIGEIETPATRDPKEKKKEGDRINGQSLGLSEAEKERIGRVLSAIKDPEMREILGDFFAKGLAVGKSRSPG